MSYNNNHLYEMQKMECGITLLYYIMRMKISTVTFSLFAFRPAIQVGIEENKMLLHPINVWMFLRTEW